MTTNKKTSKLDVYEKNTFSDGRESLDELSDLIEKTPYPKKAGLQRELANMLDGSFDAYEKHVRESVYKDYNPQNAFFDQFLKNRSHVTDSEGNKDPFYVFGSAAEIKGSHHAQEDYENFKKGVEEYKKNILPIDIKKRRHNGLKQAESKKDEIREKMKVVSKKWDKALDSKRLTKALHTKFSFEMANLLIEDPSVYDLVPTRIKDNPASELSRPLYENWRFHIEKEPEYIKDILLNDVKDYRKMGLIYLRDDAEIDKELREADPKIAQRERQRRRENRKTRDEIKKKNAEDMER